MITFIIYFDDKTFCMGRSVVCLAKMNQSIGSNLSPNALKNYLRFFDFFCISKKLYINCIQLSAQLVYGS